MRLLLQRRCPQRLQRARSRRPSLADSARRDRRITREIATEALQQRVLLYDKQGEEHYNLISALHKSVRNSDADAALYWLGRMLAAGEDPLYVARRVVRMAVEDIGLAAPEALNLSLSARDAMDFLGSPEGDLALAAGRRLSRARAQIERRLHRLRSAVSTTSRTPAPNPSRCTCATRPRS